MCNKSYYRMKIQQYYTLNNEMKKFKYMSFDKKKVQLDFIIGKKKYTGFVRYRKFDINFSKFNDSIY